MSLIDLTNWCESIGYEALPYRLERGCKIVLFKNDKLIRMGANTYPDYTEGLKDVYSKIYLKYGNT